MPSLDLMTEPELIAHLHQLADDCDKLDQRITSMIQRQRFVQDPRDAAAAGLERTLLADMSQLIGRWSADPAGHDPAPPGPSWFVRADRSMADAPTPESLSGAATVNWETC